MSSAPKNQSSSSSKPLTISLSHQTPNPNSATSNVITRSLKHPTLSRATHITRQELLRRRLHHLHQLSKCYRDHYWALMEELKVQYRDYYWKYGVSPFKDKRRQFEENNEEREHGHNSNNNFAEGGDESVSNKNNYRCLFVGCNLKAMALTYFCHLHILSDPKQKLYKPCDYVIKRAVAGPITCGKPILKSTVPSLCMVHFQKAQIHVTRALKKAGLNVSSSSKLAPKFHVIVAEYIRQIQAKRRNALKRSRSKVTVKEESVR